MRSRPVALTALLVGCVVAAAGCGSGTNSHSTSSGTSSLGSVTVKGGKTPTLALAKKPFSVTRTAVKVLTPGHGATVRKGQTVAVDYVLMDGRTGKQEDTTFGKQPQWFPADPHQVIPGIAKGMIDQKIGSRVLVGVSPADGFKAQGGNQTLGIKADDSLVLLLDIESAHTPLAHAQGTAVAPKPGLPTVKMGADDSATITVPKTPAPTKLIVTPLIVGNGAKVKSGQTVWAKYTGVIWSTGKVFDATSKNGGYAVPFPIGAGDVIPAWDKGIVGQPVGSRLLMVVPPADGYGKSGSTDGSIKGTDTLVFVIDIVDVN